MNYDFHYYGTYLAACIAGYTKIEAETIAYAAQFVDDFRTPNAPSLIGGQFICPTSENISVIKWNNLFPAERPDGPYYASSRIWTCYHFLPGNYNEEITTYTGEQLFTVQNVDSWDWCQKSKNQFQLMCHTNSPLVNKMMNDTIVNDSSYALHLLGLRLHVLEDTYSHEYFAGKPFRFINDFTSSNIEVLDNDGNVIETSSMPGSPALPTLNAEAYLGHARLGHYPDFAYVCYRYTPRWCSKPIIKNNPNDYWIAFKQVVYALDCVKQKSNFHVKTYASLVKEEDVVRQALAATSDDPPEKGWIEAIEKLGFEEPKRYSDTDWVKQYTESTDSQSTNLYYFNMAAQHHSDLICSELHQQGLYPDCQRPSVLGAVRIKNCHYARKGQANQYIAFDGSIYPIVADFGNDFMLINYTGCALAAGDIIDIVLVNAPVTMGSYLAQSNSVNTQISIYLQYAEYYTNRQNWQIEKVDGSGGEIKKGDKVYFKNRYY